MMIPNLSANITLVRDFAHIFSSNRVGVNIVLVRDDCRHWHQMRLGTETQAILFLASQDITMLIHSTA